jgi:hypothetical protein
LPDIRLNQKPETGYPVRVGYRIPGTWFNKYIFGKISNKLVKTIIDFCKHQTKHDLVTTLIFVQIFFLALFEEKLYKLLDPRNISWISCFTGYPAGQSGTYPAGYRISKKAGLYLTTFSPALFNELRLTDTIKIEC